MSFGKTTPVLRIFDEAKAREFYLDFLGFSLDWQYRFETDLPLYMQVSRGECVLHLSEYHGDCTLARHCVSKPMNWKPSSKGCWPSSIHSPTRRSRPCPGKPGHDHQRSFR